MLTRLEVNGFRNLIDFALDFGPYTCIAGPNGAGKSNVFDAIHFLSLLTERSINEAALQLRNAGELDCPSSDAAQPEQLNRIVPYTLRDIHAVLPAKYARESG